MKNLIKWLDSLFKEEVVKPPEPIVVPKPVIPPTNRELLLSEAYKALGTDITPNDKIPDTVACAETLCTLIKKIVPNFPIISYTPDLYKYLMNDSRFKQVYEFKEGLIIISPTGNSVGHCGTTGKGGKILSNNSETGLWKDKYNQLEWIEKYSRQGKLKLYLFELL